MVNCIDQDSAVWLADLVRRVQHREHRYNYRRMKLSADSTFNQLFLGHARIVGASPTPPGWCLPAQYAKHIVIL